MWVTFAGCNVWVANDLPGIERKDKRPPVQACRLAMAG